MQYFQKSCEIHTVYALIILTLYGHCDKITNRLWFSSFSYTICSLWIEEPSLSGSQSEMVADQILRQWERGRRDETAG